MAIPINRVLPVLAAQEAGSVAPELAFESGSVVNAQVLKVLSADLVRLAIASLSIDAFSEVPLQEGQTLRLAVSQTKDGVRLAVLGQGADAKGLPADAVTLSADALIEAAANPPTTTATPSKAVLTPLERLVVSVAAQTAATEQESLAPLFANLGAAALSASLPPKLQQAIVQVLAQQTLLDQNLAGGDIKAAFQKSGLFLEAALAAGSPPTAGAPDLKAALIVLRQALQSLLGTTPAPTVPAAASTAPPVAGGAALPQAAPGLASSTPEFDVQEILLPQARLPVAPDAKAGASRIGTSPLAAALDAGPSAGATMNLLQEALQELGNPARQAAMPKALGNAEVPVPANTAPPPFRGALPTAQPIAMPSLAPDAPMAVQAHQLLENTDAAIARQTLLQVASLPDRIDVPQAQIDNSSTRWSFEIPFMTLQGTAMAQFEIGRDGGGDAEAAKRVWRARFSLDVEPAGPVHALVSLTGDVTSVRMWAERSATAAQLRAGAAQLSQALSKADLRPGDIVIADGAPPQPPLARAGHFLDRAL